MRSVVNCPWSVVSCFCHWSLNIFCHVIMSPLHLLTCSHSHRLLAGTLRYGRLRVAAKLESSPHHHITRSPGHPLIPPSPFSTRRSAFCLLLAAEESAWKMVRTTIREFTSHSPKHFPLQLFIFILRFRNIRNFSHKITHGDAHERKHPQKCREFRAAKFRAYGNVCLSRPSPVLAGLQHAEHGDYTAATKSLKFLPTPKPLATKPQPLASHGRVAAN
jgi:hypothetical protein